MWDYKEKTKMYERKDSKELVGLDFGKVTDVSAQVSTKELSRKWRQIPLPKPP